MGVLDVFKRMKEDREVSKARFKEAEESQKIERILIERQKSANQRELERYLKEENEKVIKEELERVRIIRQKDIDFGHNSLNAKNVINNQKNIFKGKSTILNSKKLFTR